jgi:hypothetical protein
MRDIIDKQFGWWHVLRFDHRQGGAYYYLCRCDCGTIKPVRSDELKKGTSCGCMHNKALKGMSHHPLHGTWAMMHSRCYNPKSKHYDYYGGRGIRVCIRWRHTLQGLKNFIADMGPRPEGSTLDRKDNDEWYMPSNCRWATRTEQIRNRRMKKAA